MKPSMPESPAVVLAHLFERPNAEEQRGTGARTLIPQPAVAKSRSTLAGRIKQLSARARGRYPIAPTPTATLRRCPIQPSPAAPPLPEPSISPGPPRTGAHAGLASEEAPGTAGQRGAVEGLPPTASDGALPAGAAGAALEARQQVRRMLAWMHRHRLAILPAGPAAGCVGAPGRSWQPARWSSANSLPANR